MSNFSRIRAENQFVFLNTGLIYGINSLKTTDNFGDTSVKYIGIGHKSINESVNSAQYTDLSINSLLINEDVFIQQTGLQPINCFILQDPTSTRNSYSLISGYLNHYSAKYSINQPPQIAANLRFYNNVGNIPTGNLDPYSFSQISGIINSQYLPFNGDVADSNFINLTLAEYQTNRVIDYTFSIDINRLPIYNIGTRFPKKIELVFPVNITCDVTFEADENFTDVSLTDFPLNKTVQNINLQVYSNKTNLLMAGYTFQNMTLISNDRDTNIDGNLIVSRRYIGQLFGFTDYITNAIFSINTLDFGFVASGAGFYLDWGILPAPVISGMDFSTI